MTKSPKKRYTVDKTEKNFNRSRLKSGDRHKEIQGRKESNICANFSCRMRKAGCKGFEGCPGYMSK